MKHKRLLLPLLAPLLFSCGTPPVASSNPTGLSVPTQSSLNSGFDYRLLEEKVNAIANLANWTFEMAYEGLPEGASYIPVQKRDHDLIYYKQCVMGRDGVTHTVIEYERAADAINIYTSSDASSWQKRVAEDTEKTAYRLSFTDNSTESGIIDMYKSGMKTERGVELHYHNEGETYENTTNVLYTLEQGSLVVITDSTLKTGTSTTTTRQRAFGFGTTTIDLRYK